MVMLAGVNQSQWFFGLANVDSVTVGQFKRYLAITGDTDIITIAIDDDDFYFAITINDDGSVTHRVRANGDNGDGIQCRVDDRAAGGKGVGRATRWGGDDKAIGALAMDQSLIDIGFQFDHPGHVPFVDDDLIQGVALLE